MKVLPRAVTAVVCPAEASGVRHELKRAVALDAPLVLRVRHLHKPAAIRPLC